MFYIRKTDYETDYAAILPNGDIASVSHNTITGDYYITVAQPDRDEPLSMIEDFSASTQAEFAKAFNEYCEWEQATRNTIIESTGINLTIH